MTIIQPLHAAWLQYNSPAMRGRSRKGFPHMQWRGGGELFQYGEHGGTKGWGRVSQ
eukprot:COSAG01_NODE_2584_length_7418_cov_4.468643_4_plen_56_part_00